MAAVWQLKTVFETRVNGWAPGPGPPLRLQCVWFTEGNVPERLSEIDLAPLALWFANCGRAQTMKFGAVRSYETGGYGISTTVAGWCGEMRVEARDGRWSADHQVGECGFSGVRSKTTEESDAGDPTSHDVVFRLRLLHADSADALPPPPERADSLPSVGRPIPITDSLFYLQVERDGETRRWGRRLAPPSGLDSLAFKIGRSFHYLAIAGEKAFVLDLPAGSVIAYDTVGRPIASRKLPQGLADTLRAGVHFEGSERGYTMSLPIASFAYEGGWLVVKGRRLVLVDPETLGVQTLGGPWRLLISGEETAVRGDTLFALTRFDWRKTYQMIPVPQEMPLVQREGFEW